MFTVAIILQLILSYSSLANPIPSGVSKNVDESNDVDSSDGDNDVDNDGDIDYTNFINFILCVLLAVCAWNLIGIFLTCCFKTDVCCWCCSCNCFDNCQCDFIPFISPCNRNKFFNFRQCPSPTRVTTSQQGLNFRMTGNIKNPYYDWYNMDIPYLPQRVSNDDSETNDLSPSVESDPASQLNVAISSKNDDLDDNDLGNQNLTEV